MPSHYLGSAVFQAHLSQWMVWVWAWVYPQWPASLNGINVLLAADSFLCLASIRISSSFNPKHTISILMVERKIMMDNVLKHCLSYWGRWKHPSRSPLWATESLSNLSKSQYSSACLILWLHAPHQRGSHLGSSSQNAFESPVLLLLISTLTHMLVLLDIPIFWVFVDVTLGRQMHSATPSLSQQHLLHFLQYQYQYQYQY